MTVPERVFFLLLLLLLWPHPPSSLSSFNLMGSIQQWLSLSKPLPIYGQNPQLYCSLSMRSSSKSSPKQRHWISTLFSHFLIPDISLEKFIVNIPKLILDALCGLELSRCHAKQGISFYCAPSLFSCFLIQNQMQQCLCLQHGRTKMQWRQDFQCCQCAQQASIHRAFWHWQKSSIKCN